MFFLTVSPPDGGRLAVLLRTKSGQKMEVKAILSALETISVNHMKGATLEETKVVEYP